MIKLMKLESFGWTLMSMLVTGIILLLIALMHNTANISSTPMQPDNKYFNAENNIHVGTVLAYVSGRLSNHRPTIFV